MAEQGWPSTISRARGPFGVVVASLRRLGWQPTDSPLRFLDHDGEVLSILELGPALMRRLALAAHRRTLQIAAAEKLAPQLPSPLPTSVRLDSYHIRQLPSGTGPFSDLTPLQ